MKKKTLKDKIDNVIFWTVVFIILYFIVGYLLESEWLSILLNLKQVHALLKDTLTLTATFLAPVAALVLFSDWRDQHRQVREETEVLQHLSKIKRDSDRLNEIFSEINNDFELDGIKIIEKFQNVIEDEINAIEKNEIDLDYIISLADQTDFFERVRELTMNQGRLLRSIYIMFRRRIKLEECSVSAYSEVDLPHALKSEYKASLIFYERVHTYLEDFDKKIKQIEHAAKLHKI